uniref:Uncharacterized protein n=1 Tax=Arundo donax TaxID=35708 RepID=A0A0A9T422_ARUDO
MPLDCIQTCPFYVIYSCIRLVSNQALQRCWKPVFYC